MVKNINVSIWRDEFAAILAASITLGVWSSIYCFFGNNSTLNDSFITFLGGVLAISGLLFRQYMLKEVLDYLKSWERMSRLLNTIVELASTKCQDKKELTENMALQEKVANEYTHYIKLELSIVPVVPLILIFLYGCAVLSETSYILRMSCLFIMVQQVAYLAIAAVTSTRLACAYPDLEKTISELDDLRKEIENI